MCRAELSASFFSVTAGTSRPPKEGGNHATTCSNILSNKGVCLINLPEKEELPSFSISPFELGVAVTDG